MNLELTAGQAIYLKKRFLERKNIRDIMLDLNLTRQRLRQIEFVSVKKLMYFYNKVLWDRMS